MRSLCEHWRDRVERLVGWEQLAGLTYMRENLPLGLYRQIGNTEERAGRGSRSLVAASGHGDW